MTAAKGNPIDQRQHGRIVTALRGEMFVPAEDCTLQCDVTNLSLGGAGVRCDEPPPLSAFVILQVDGLGHYDCVVSRYIDGELGLRFVCDEVKRKELMATLTHLVQSGTTSTDDLRAHARWRSNVDADFKLADGISRPCQIVDFSLQGVSLRTECKPPVGEIVIVGRSHGRVVRHLEYGIAIRFLDVDESLENAD